VRACGVVLFGTAALVAGTVAATPASAQTTSVALFPPTVTVPADGSIQGAFTATVAPVEVGVTVTAVESDGVAGSGATASCVTNSLGQCQILTNHNGAATTGTVTAGVTGCAGCTSTGAVDFVAPGTAPTGLTLNVANGNGTAAPAGPAGADVFSDANHYFVQESSGSSDDYEGTPSEAVVGASLMNAGTALSAGVEPYAINWTIKDTSTTNILNLDSVTSTASLAYNPPVSNVVCTIRDQTDPNRDPACTPLSFDLDQEYHFSNPATPTLDDLGAYNNTLPPDETVLVPGQTISFTTYMIGQLNNAQIVLDSKTGYTASATVSAQLATDPAGSTIEGSTIGSAPSTSTVWLPQAAAGSSAIGILSASDVTGGWVVINVNGVVELVNFTEATGSTYNAGGASVSLAQFKTDLATYPTYQVSGYLQNGQVNSLLTRVLPPPPTPKWGYWTVASDGGIFAFGDANFYGSMGGQHLNAPMVGMARTPDSLGYWTVAADGGIFSFGDAASHFYGSEGGKHLNAPIVAMAPTATGNGYWLVASDGGVFAFGDAKFDGSMGGTHLNAPVVGMAVTPDGNGYWLVASDGGIFSFGDAANHFYGSEGGKHLNKPMVGMDVSETGNGYWTVASDGGIFAFGDAVFYGSMGGLHLNAPMVGMAATPDGKGYWTVASDGGIFSFGDAAGHFFGSMGGTHLNAPMVGMAETAT